MENPHGFKRAPGHEPGIQLDLKDEGTGIVTNCKLTLHDAKNLYLALREIFGDYERPSPELFTTVPKCTIQVERLMPKRVNGVIR